VLNTAIPSSTCSWGTTTIEPIGQLIIRPNEPNAGRLPNEDAQSFTFDDSNLFRVDKFSGYDRVEGGGRANVGVQATTQFDRGGSINVLFGQSYQLFGLNSFAVQDLTNTGLGGLATDRSDYVARMSYQPNRIYSLTARTRLDEATGAVRRLNSKAAPASIASRSACFTATTISSRNSASSTAAKALSEPALSRWRRTGFCPAVCATTLPTRP
jgi:lipopolysaccharide assembly outer membrane protein LptD (OstA)